VVHAQALIAALLLSVTGATAAEAYDTCNGRLMQERNQLYIASEIDGEQVEGECQLPASQRNRILRACQVKQLCTVVGITKNTCGPDCTSMVKIISISADK
jgi:hypothetical protein